MFKFWRFLNGTTLFFDAPDAGGGGGDEGGGDDNPELEHPDFEFPGGGGADEGGEDDPDDPAGQGGPDPKAGKGDAGKGGKKPGQQPVDSVPKHRLDEVIGQRDRLQSENATTRAELDKLKRLVAQSLGIADPNDPARPKELSPREKAIQERIIQLIPGLGNLLKLADKADQIAAVAESAPEFDRQSKAYWGRIAQQTIGRMEDAVAEVFLGKGKKANDLSKEQRARFRMDFFGWVNSDERRQDRYEAQDGTLIEDYRKELDSLYVQPVRRQAGAAALDRSRQTRNLPVGGNGSAPVAGAKPKGKPLDEDAAADAAWKNLQERLQTQA